MGSTLQIPWKHDGYERIRVVIAQDLRPESHALLVAFRSLREATTLDEVRAKANDIADARDVRLTWTTEPDDADPAGLLITIDVVRA
jgi:hypothetical protein